MAEAAPPGGTILQLFFLGQSRRWLRLLTAAGVIIGCGLCAFGLMRLESHYAAVTGASGLAGAIGRGSVAGTAWPGWVAALFFALSLLRLRRGEPEPPTSRTPVNQLSVSDIRSGFRTEYRSFRIALCVVAVLALVDAERALAIAWEAARGHTWAQGTLPATLIEAAGWLVASGLFTTWLLTFRRQLDRWGAV